MKRPTVMNILLAVSFLFGSAAASAQDFNLNSLGAKDMNASVQAREKGIMDWIKPSDPDKPVPVKDWTVMVFMSSKNDLAASVAFGLAGKWAEKDLKEMKKVGTTDKVNVTAEYGMAGKGIKRMLVGKSGLLNSGETVYAEGDGDMGDYKRVIDFVKWSKTRFPARRYMLVLWNHGLGWIDPDLQAHSAGTGTSGSKGILFDDETKNYVRTRQLGEILRQTGYVDVFVMNACLMQMAEVAYEVKDNTGLIVASEETMLAFGFDYEKLLNYMNSNTGATNEQLSDFFINWQKQFYAEGAPVGPIHVPLTGMAATMSTLRPQALNGLPRYLDAFAGAAMNNSEEAAVRTAVEKAIRFTSLDPKNDKKKLLAAYVDLYDFVRIAGENAAAAQTREAAAALMSYITNTLVMRSAGLNGDPENGYDYAKVGGIAINMTMKIKNPPPQLGAIFETRYSDLSLSQASLWDEFVAWTDKAWQAK